jgi:TonB family protein
MILPALMVVWAAAGMAQTSARKPETPPEVGKSAAFEPLRERLVESTKATVSPACGSAIWPWAYRGKLGANRTLRPYGSTAVQAGWVRDFVTLLFHAADWDSVTKYRGLSKPCDQGHDVPLFAVTFDAKGGDVYALLSLETRCAQIFEAEKPLGTVWFKDRADSLFALLQSALPQDSIVAWMSLPPEIPAPAGETISAFYGVEVLPEPVERIPPQYPEEGIRAGKSGTVWVRALVGEDGAVHDAFVHRSIPPLDDAALDAVWQWRFKPALSGGKPIAVWVMVPVRFTLH